MRKREYEEDIINEAVGFADTDDEEILAARAVYKELYDKFNAEVKERLRMLKPQAVFIFWVLSAMNKTY